MGTAVLLRPNPSNNLVDHLVNRKIGRVENMHTPSRVTALPIGPTVPPHHIELSAAYHILPPLGIDRVHALPRRPGQHILCNSMCSTLPKAVQTHYIVAIEESDVNFVNVGR